MRGEKASEGRETSAVDANVANASRGANLRDIAGQLAGMQLEMARREVLRDLRGGYISFRLRGGSWTLKADDS